MRTWYVTAIWPNGKIDAISGPYLTRDDALAVQDEVMDMIRKCDSTFLYAGTGIGRVETVSGREPVEVLPGHFISLNY